MNARVRCARVKFACVYTGVAHRGSVSLSVSLFHYRLYYEALILGVKEKCRRRCGGGRSRGHVGNRFVFHTLDFPILTRAARQSINIHVMRPRRSVILIEREISPLRTYFRFFFFLISLSLRATLIGRSITIRDAKEQTRNEKVTFLSRERDTKRARKLIRESSRITSGGAAARLKNCSTLSYGSSAPFRE